ncbi:hypothetical protein DOFOFD_11760 [Acetobacteraceae bacterium EV16P]|uniref:Uncharacterized protein n=1 Tax=Sorlinia euscelidii TaxID=3081148 RepID=A0ABU7U4A0_9PROT
MNDFLKITDLHAEVAMSEPPKKILNGLTLSVPQGEVHAIMGPNGSGNRRSLIFWPGARIMP